MVTDVVEESRFVLIENALRGAMQEGQAGVPPTRGPFRSLSDQVRKQRGLHALVDARCRPSPDRLDQRHVADIARHVEAARGLDPRPAEPASAMDSLSRNAQGFEFSALALQQARGLEPFGEETIRLRKRIARANLRSVAAAERDVF